MENQHMERTDQAEQPPDNRHCVLLSEEKHLIANKILTSKVQVHAPMHIYVCFSKKTMRAQEMIQGWLQKEGENAAPSMDILQSGGN